MKKLLSCLSVFGLTATGSINTISCSKKYTYTGEYKNDTFANVENYLLNVNNGKNKNMLFSKAGRIYDETTKQKLWEINVTYLNGYSPDVEYLCYIDKHYYSYSVTSQSDSQDVSQDTITGINDVINTLYDQKATSELNQFKKLWLIPLSRYQPEKELDVTYSLKNTLVFINDDNQTQIYYEYNNGTFDKIKWA